MGAIFRPRYKYQGRLCESAVWWVRYFVDGKVCRESTGKEDREAAKEFLRAKESEAAGGAPAPSSGRRILVHDLLQLVEADYELNNYSSIEHLKRIIKKNIGPHFGTMRASQVTPDQIDRYALKRRNEGCSNRTINIEVNIVKRAFALGVEKKKITYRPKWKNLKEAPPRKGFFERDQFESVVRHLPERLKNPVRFAYITGWRSKSEILVLQWPQVDFEACTVRIEPGESKNREARMFPFTDELRAILLEQRAKADELKRRRIITPWVFFYEKGKWAGRPLGEYKKAWNTACRLAGVPGRIMHDFRRTAARNLEQAGVPRTVAMQLMGHKTESMYRRYRIVSEADLLGAAEIMNSYRQRNRQRIGISRHSGEDEGL